jgi:hypothetical protein
LIDEQTHRGQMSVQFYLTGTIKYYIVVVVVLFYLYKRLNTLNPWLWENALKQILDLAQVSMRKIALFFNRFHAKSEFDCEK